MAHAVETMAYAIEKPWHGLGFEVSNDLTAEEMLKAAKLDWTVSQHPLFAMYNDNEQVSCGKKRALIRDQDKKILDIVSDDWKPTQNADAFEFFREYVEAGNMTMETAGSLNGGRNVWALAKINESFEAVKDDVVDGYLLFSNPHRYGQAINVKQTSIRVVCANTLSWALQNSASKFSTSVNHSRKFDAEAVKTELGIAKHQLAEAKEKAIFLASKHFNQDNVIEFLKKVFPTQSVEKELSKPAETTLELLNTQPGANFGEGTYWQLLNAVTYAVDHKLGRNTDTRLNSAWFGTNERRKTVALNTALEMADAA